MRLAFKLTVALFLSVFLGLTVFGFVQVDRERTLFNSDMRRDGRLIGVTLASAVAQVWAAEGRSRALALVRHANVEAEAVSVRWVATDRLDGEVAAAIRRGEEAERTVASKTGGMRLVVYVPVKRGAEIGGAIAVAHSLTEPRLYIRESVLNIVLSASLIALACALSSLIFGAMLIGRPLASLVAMAREAASGRLSVRATVTQRDEIGVLASELNRMLERLAEARDRAESEAAARVASEDQLRHADRLTTVGTLASAVAHELGTPLNVVSGRAQMISSGELVGDEVAKSAAIIVGQVERMARYLRQILDFARSRSRAVQRCDLRALTQRTLELLEPLAHKRAVTLTLEGDDQAVVASVDSDAVQQVIANLVVNAIQAIDGGGNVVVCLGQSDERVTVVVRDSGGGIESADLERLFQPFFTTKPVGEGTGLGLSVAMEIAHDHEGTIEVVSVPDEGTTFSLILPRSR